MTEEWEKVEKKLRDIAEFTQDMEQDTVVPKETNTDKDVIRFACKSMLILERDKNELIESIKYLSSIIKTSGRWTHSCDRRLQEAIRKQGD